MRKHAQNFSLPVGIIVGLFLGLSVSSVQAQEIIVKEVKEVKFISSEHYFTFEDFNHPEIMELIKKEGINELIKDRVTEFGKILKVKDWVRKQLDNKEQALNYPPWNATVILDWARRNKTQVLCGHYAVVLAQVLTGLDIPARYINLSSKDQQAHFVIEAWSTDFNKWVLIDPYLDIYYRRNGIPLNALELHLAFINDSFKGIKTIKQGVTKEIKDAEPLKIFYNFEIVLRNNHISQPVSFFDVVVNVAPNIVVKYLWDDYKIKYEAILNKSLFYWDPDVCKVTIKNKDPLTGIVTLEFNNLVKSVDKYLVLENGRYMITPKEYSWKLEKGFNELTVVPLKEKLDSQSCISIEYK